MSKENRVKEILSFVTNFGAPICDGCIEKKLGFTDKVANPISNAFKDDGVFERTRHVSKCSVCGKYNYVNSIST